MAGALAGPCGSQPAVHVATASASHRNEWHAPGSTGHGTVPTMPGTPSVPLAACTLCWMCKAIVTRLRNDNSQTLSLQPLVSICLSFMSLSYSFYIKSLKAFTFIFKATTLLSSDYQGMSIVV